MGLDDAIKFNVEISVVLQQMLYEIYDDYYSGGLGVHFILEKKQQLDYRVNVAYTNDDEVSLYASQLFEPSTCRLCVVSFFW